MAGFKLVFLLVLLPLITSKTLNNQKIMQDMMAKINKLENELEDIIDLADENKQQYHDGEGEVKTKKKSDAFQHVIDAGGAANKDRKNFEQLDERLTDQQEAELKGQTKRDLIKITTSYWDDKYSENGEELIKVPYVLDSSLNSEALRTIQLAVDEFTAKTCLRLQLRNNDANYINFFPGGGCWSYVGRIGGKQNISIGDGCEWKSTVVHEVMHALGYFHEQSRQDRDTYIQVNLDNVYDEYKSQFDKQDTDNQGTEYDYDSVMHYGATAFSKNGGYTIERIGGSDALKYTFGSDDGLSTIDAVAVNKIYCSSTSTTVTPVTVTATLTPVTATTSTEQPDSTTSTEQPEVSTTEQPDSTTSTEQPVVSTSTEQPMVSTSTEQPDSTTSTEQPEVSTTEWPEVSTTEWPEMSTTEQPEQSTTSEPEVSTTADPSTCVQWPVDNGEFCNLVQRRGFCQFCSHSNHCAHTCIDKKPELCEKKLNAYYERTGQTKPSDEQKRAMRAEGKQNKKKNRKHPCDRWWYSRNCAGSCAYHYCDGTGSD